MDSSDNLHAANASSQAEGADASTTSAAAAVSGAVERLVAAAAAEVEIAAQRSRAEAHRETVRLQTLVDNAQRETGRLQALVDNANLETGRLQTLVDDAHLETGRLQTLVDNANLETGRLQTLVDNLQAELAEERDRLKLALEEVSGLKRQVEAEHAERARLIDALRAVQRAAAFTDPRPEADPTPVPQKEAEAEQAPADTGNVADALSVNRLLKLVTNTRGADAESHPELLEYVKQLLAEMETIYWADLRSEANAADVVDRLTANLRYARDVFTRRLATYDGGEPALFEQQIAILLDSKPETSFARHLAIAAYEYSLSQSTRPQHRAEAS